MATSLRDDSAFITSSTLLSTPTSFSTTSLSTSPLPVQPTTHAPIVALTVGITLATAVYIATVTVCIVLALRRASQRREERDKLSVILGTNYWPHRAAFQAMLRVLSTLDGDELFRGATSFHVLAYKFRFDPSVSESPLPSADDVLLRARTVQRTVDVYATLRKLDRLYESLCIALPCEGRCSAQLRETLGVTLSDLAVGTSGIWSDRKRGVMLRLIRYFSGRGAAAAFGAASISDASLRAMVNGKIPYVDLLYFNGDRFVLKDLRLSPAVDPRAELRNKIRFIDTTLSRDMKTLAHLNDRSLPESYRSARDLCFSYRLVQSRSHHPDIPSIAPPPAGSARGDVTDPVTSLCVNQLRHLVRLMAANLSVIEQDDDFFQFLVRLHENLYGWAEGDATAVLGLVDRARTAIVAQLNGIAGTERAVLARNRELTKQTLEQVERDLYAHLHYLTTQRLDERRRAPKQRLGFVDEPRVEGDSSPTPRGVGGGTSEGVGPATSPSELSVYSSAVAIHRRQSPSERGSVAEETSLLLGSRGEGSGIVTGAFSGDQGSILSGSSVYATAASISSGSEGLRGPGYRYPGSPPLRAMLLIDRGVGSDSEEAEFLESPV